MLRTQQLDQAKAKFESDGFYLCDQPVVPADVVHRAVDGMDAIRAGRYDTGVAPEKSPWNPGDDPNALCKIEVPQVASRAVMDLVSHPVIGRLAAAATGADWVQVWWVQLLYKPPAVTDTPQRPTNVGWHQDRYYWQCWEDSSELFTAWVALSDVTEQAGPMKFVRGSHLWGLCEEGDFFGQDHDRQRREIQGAHVGPWEEVLAILPPGGVSIHHNLTYHASGPNLSDAPRRSFAIHMRTENSAPKDDLSSGLTRFIDDPAYCPVVYPTS